MGMLNELRPFLDSIGMIGHKSRVTGLEFGDAPQRTFSYYIYRFLVGTPEERALNAVVVEKILDNLLAKLPPEATVKVGKSPLQYKRYWTGGAWYAEFWTLSRDQFVPLWIASVLYQGLAVGIKTHADLCELLARSRLGLCWNYKSIWANKNDEPNLPDVLSPSFIWMMGLRAGANASWYIHAMLAVLDLELVFNAFVIWWRSRKDPTKTSDDLNFHLHFMFASSVMPSHTLSIAKWIYRQRVKPHKYASEPLVSMAVQKSYFADPMAPPMFLVSQPALEKYLP
jgi:hypothetical protein